MVDLIIDRLFWLDLCHISKECRAVRYPSPQEIDELKSRGYDRVLLDEQSSSEQWARANELIEKIRHAFAGVVLGDGVGLRQGCALDDWLSEEECLKHREDDEKEDWSRISSEDLWQLQCLSFLDAEGFRFHLPAYMIDSLRTGNDLITRHLTNFGILGHSRMELLNSEQRQVVVEYLEFIREDSFSERSGIDAALDSYWRK